MNFITESGVEFVVDVVNGHNIADFSKPVKLWTGEILSGKVDITEQWLTWGSFAADIEDAEYA